MLTAQRFQLSVLAGGEAERWPPISLNTPSPRPSTPDSLSLPFSFSISSSPLRGLVEGRVWGLTARSVPGCQKGPVIQPPPSGTVENTHMHTHTYTCTHTHASMHTLTELTLAQAFDTTHTHAHTHTQPLFFFFPTQSENTRPYTNF